MWRTLVVVVAACSGSSNQTGPGPVGYACMDLAKQLEKDGGPRDKIDALKARGCKLDKKSDASCQ